MFVKGLRKFLYAGALLALAPIMGLSQDKKAEPIPAAAPGPATSCAPACPTTCKVKVCEWVDEPCEYTKTVYKPVTKEVTYTAYECKTVTETCTKQVTEYQKVCETVMECKTIVKKVPCWEEKTEMVSKWKCVQVTEMVSKTHYSHHWECCEVPASGGLFSHGCKSSCGDPCNTCCSAPCTKTVKKLVVDKCTECVPVCRTKLVKECVPVCKKVCTYKCVTETVNCPVTKVKCVPVCKTVTYNVCKKVSVPVQCKKMVTECVPVCETVKGTKKVAHWVEKEVPVAPCCDTCATACCGTSLFGGLRARFAKSCCSSGCGSACGVATTCSSCGK
jgi:hypothetical protein